MDSNSRQRTIVTEKDDVPPAPAHVRDDTAMCTVSVKGLRENWQKWTDERREYQRRNPFSCDSRPCVEAPLRGQEGYGKPTPGSLTEQRGKNAHAHTSREVQELCEVIRTIGVTRYADATNGNVTTVEFGKLFEHYVTISNKLVGILRRARKHRLVDFDGEVLWQGRDDRVVISLLQ